MNPNEKEKRLLVSYYAMVIQATAIDDHNKGADKETLKELAKRMDGWLESLTR